MMETLELRQEQSKLKIHSPPHLFHSTSCPQAGKLGMEIVVSS